MPKEIIIEIGDDGAIELRAEGYKGKGCEQATKFIEEALGMEKGKRTKKPEYYAQEIVREKQKA